MEATAADAAEQQMSCVECTVGKHRDLGYLDFGTAMEKTIRNSVTMVTTVTTMDRIWDNRKWTRLTGSVHRMEDTISSRATDVRCPENTVLTRWTLPNSYMGLLLYEFCRAWESILDKSTFTKRWNKTTFQLY